MHIQSGCCQLPVSLYSVLDISQGNHLSSIRLYSLLLCLGCQSCIPFWIWNFQPIHNTDIPVPNTISQGYVTLCLPCLPASYSLLLHVGLSERLPTILCQTNSVSERERCHCQKCVYKQCCQTDDNYHICVIILTSVRCMFNNGKKSHTVDNFRMFFVAHM